jgi:hypothetical protein
MTARKGHYTIEFLVAVIDTTFYPQNKFQA